MKLHVSDISSVHHQEFIHCTLSNGICLYVIQVCRQLSSRSICFRVDGVILCDIESISTFGFISFLELGNNYEFFFIFEVKNTSERSYSIVLKYRDRCAACTSNIA